MKYSWTLAGLLLLGGCGNSAINGEATGQAKKLTDTTPMFCPDYKMFDMSMGILRNGTGSISSQDMYFTMAYPDPAMIKTLKEAVANNLIVKVHYNTRRAAFCTEDYILTSVEIVKE